MSHDSFSANGDARFVGRLVLGRLRVVYVGPGGGASRHAHPAVQLVVARAGAFTLSLRDEAPRRARAALVPAGVPHALDAAAVPIALVLVERHDARGARLDAIARAGISEPDLLARLEGELPEGRPAALLARADAWIDAVLGEGPRPTPTSSAVRRALAYLESCVSGGERPSLAEAASHAGLSPVRLTHRFTEEVGAPMRAIVPWLRMTRAVEVLARRPDRTSSLGLTEAAHAAGFVDAAHMSRTFKRAFGIPPVAFFGAAEAVSWLDPPAGRGRS